MERTVRIDPSERIRDCETKGAAVVWPLPVDNLLDDLVNLADAAGMPTTRKELTAAIVLAAPRDGEKLAKLLLAYRRAKAGDLIEPPAGENVLQFQVRKPGPRSRGRRPGQPG